MHNHELYCYRGAAAPFSAITAAVVVVLAMTIAVCRYGANCYPPTC